MRKPVRFLKPDRLARLIAWAVAMLVWVGDALLGEGAPNRRRLRQRGRFLSLDRLARFTCWLALIRAVEIAGIRWRGRVVRNTAPAGFRRRTVPCAQTRACIGARLRKAMRSGDPAARMRFITAALADIDAFARRHLVARVLRRLTKRCAVVLFAPPAAALLGAPALPPACADSS